MRSEKILASTSVTPSTPLVPQAIIFTAPISCTGNITGTGDDVPGGSDGEVSSPISSFPTPPGLITNELIVYGETFNNEIPIYGKVNSDAAGFYLAASTTEFQSEIVSNLTKFDVILSEAKDLFRPISLAHATTINTEIPIPNVSNHTCDDAGVSYTKILEDGSLEGALYVPGGSDMVYLAITDCVSQWSEVVTDEVNSALNFYDSVPKSLIVGTESSNDPEDNTEFFPLFVLDENGKIKESALKEDKATVLGDRNENFRQDELAGSEKLSFDASENKLVAMSLASGVTNADAENVQDLDDPLRFDLVNEVLNTVPETEKYTHLKETVNGSVWFGTRPEEEADDYGYLGKIFSATETNPEGTQYCDAKNSYKETNCVGFKETTVFDQMADQNKSVIISAANINDNETKLYFKYLDAVQPDRDVELGGNNSFNLNDHNFIDLSIVKNQSEDKPGKFIVTDKIKRGIWLFEYFIDPVLDNQVFNDEVDPTKFIQLDKAPLAIDFSKNKYVAFVLSEDRGSIEVLNLKSNDGNVLDLNQIKSSKQIINLKDYLNGKNSLVSSNSITIHQFANNKAKIIVGSKDLKAAMIIDHDLTVFKNEGNEEDNDNSDLPKKPELEEEQPTKPNLNGSFNNSGTNDDGTEVGDDYF